MFRSLLVFLAVTLLAGCGLDVKPGAEGLFDAFLAGPTPEQAARMAINDWDANDRTNGTLLLANAFFAGESPYVALFVDNARDEESSVRAAAIRGLANHGQPVHVPLLVSGLGDDDALVRAEAARGMQRLHNPVAVEALVRAVDENTETEAEVRAEAASALGQYAENRVARALIAALADPSLAVNRNALASLRVLTGQDFGFDRRAWLDWMSGAKDPFAARGVYTYPAFHRPRRLIEYLPLVPLPPNEISAPPAGFPLDGG